MRKAESKDTSVRHAWGWLFLTAVIVAYVWLYFLNPDVVKSAWLSFGVLASKIGPVLAIVFALLFLFNILAEPKWIGRYVGEKSGVRGWIVAIVAGALSLGPIYPWYILLGELKKKGMHFSLIAVFLYARAIKLPLVPLMAHYFGVAFTIILLVYILVFAVLNGLVMKFLFSRDWLKNR